MSYLAANYLIVDDNDTALNVLNRALNSLNVTGEIFVATDGSDACKFLIDAIKNGTKIDFIICDMVMPVLDGLDVLEFVRKDPQLKSVPFLMLTAENDRSTVTKCIKAGITHYLLKPWKIEELEEKMKFCWTKVHRD